jgi:hypothetical protein
MTEDMEWHAPMLEELSIPGGTESGGDGDNPADDGSIS